MKNSRGQAAIELGFILPVFMTVVVAFAGLAIMCIKGELLSVVAFEASRNSGIFQRETSSVLYASLAPGLLKGLDIRDVRVSGLNELSMASMRFAMPGFSGRMSRGFEIVPAVPGDFSGDVLRGGDTPSPYCRQGDDIKICGYAE